MCGLVLLRFLEPKVTAARVVERISNRPSKLYNIRMAATVIFLNGCESYIFSSYKLFVNLFYNKCKRYNK